MENKLSHRDIWIVVSTVIVFIVWKLSMLSFRFGDENVYFYMSNALLHGFSPYKDFFLADPPFFVYLMALFKSFFSSHIILFKTLPILFDSLNAILLYLLLRRKNAFAFLAPIFYLFSFTVLSTSDYVTGAEIMIFFVLLAFYFDQKQKHYYSGIFWALACLCKLYAGPALLGLLFYKIISKDYLSLKKIIIGGLVTTLFIMLPFLIMAPGQTFYDLIIHQFNRPPGINKWNIFGVFIGFEWLLLLSSFYGIFITKNKQWIYPFIFSLIFFLLYKDLYYLYLHLLFPFIVLLSIEFIKFLNKKKEEMAWIFLIVYFCVLIYSVLGYINVYQMQGIFKNPEEIANIFKNTPDDVPIYGAQEVAPLIALLANKNIFNNVIDTNTQNFAAHTHDLGSISNMATENGIYLVARVANYPEQKIINTGFEGYFDKNIFDKTCQPYASFDRSVAGDPLNQVAIYKCILYTR